MLRPAGLRKNKEQSCWTPCPYREARVKNKQCVWDVTPYSLAADYDNNYKTHSWAGLRGNCVAAGLGGEGGVEGVGGETGGKETTGET